MKELISRYLINPGKQRLCPMFVNQKQWQEWSSAWRFFFVLAQGRAGTKFLANLLNQAQGAYVLHEPVLEDFFAYLRAFHNPGKAKKYIHGFRKKEIYCRMQNMTTGVYGEVNSILRCHADAIRDVFPGVVLVHLVRDGRDVVRSILSRNTFTWRSPYSLGIYPGRNDPWKGYWPEMDRFARVCWYWQVENKRLRESVGKIVQFEKILSGYQYFFKEILEPCGIYLSKEAWESSISSPRNITSKFTVPKWENWTLEQKKKFEEICGDEMIQCGYDI